MKNPHRNVSELMELAANDMRLDTSTAQMFVRVASELMRQQEEIDNLRLAVEQQAEKLSGSTSQLGRKIDKLQGVHGA